LWEDAASPWATPVAYDATPGGPNNHYKGLGNLAKHVWATPKTSDTNGQRLTKMNRNGTLRRRNRKDTQSYGINLADQVKAWPTMTASDSERHDSDTIRHASLGAAVCRTQGRGSLNPEWVECLMGFPPGWTVCDGPPCPENHSTPGNFREPQSESPIGLGG